MNRTIGIASAFLVASSIGGFALSMLAGSENASYAASLLLAWAFVVMASAFATVAASNSNVAGQAGTGFAILYAAFATAVYFVQLTTVLHQSAPPDILKVLSYQELGSVMFNFELLGYALMSVSTFFIGLTVSSASRTGKWLRYMLLVHGVFAPVCLALPMMDVFGAMPRASGATIGIAISFGWCAYFLPVAVLAIIYLQVAHPGDPYPLHGANPP